MRPEPMNEDELHDALVVHGFLTDDEARAWPTMLANLKQARRVVRLCIPCRSGDGLGFVAERRREMRDVLADAHVDGDAPELGAPIDADTALRELMRSRLELHGPVTATVLGAPLGLSADAIAVALLALEQQGYVMRGTFAPEAIAARDTEWCARRERKSVVHGTR